MKKSAFISDILFAFLGVSVFTLCLFRYLGLTLPLSACLAVFCGGLAGVCVWALLSTKRNAFFLKKSDERQKEKLLLHLALLSAERKTQYFCNALSAKRIGPLKIATADELIFLRFGFAPVTADEVATLFRQRSAKQKTLFCGEVEENAKRLCLRLGIRVKTGEEVYQVLKQQEFLPKEFLGEEAPEDKKLRRKTTCFAKRNASRFFASGTLILLTSLFTPFPYYYLIFGSVLLLISLLVRILGYA